MGCGGAVWDAVTDFVDDTIDFAKDIVDDVVDFTENVIEDTIKTVADVASKLNNIIEIPVLSDLVNDAIKITEDTLLKTVDITFDGVRIVNDAAYYTMKGVSATLQRGNPLELILTVAAAIATGGTSLIYQYAIPGITNSLYMHGVISQEWAMAINIGAQLYAIFYGVTNPDSVTNSLTSTFTWMGVSSSTALYLANAISTAVTIAGPAMQVYGMYEAYNTVKSLEDMYATKLAEYEAWRNSFQQNQVKQETSWQEGMSYADGTYYEKMPGKFMYGVFSASREAYVPMDVTQPAYWVEDTKPPFTTDKEVANIMWDVKDVEFRNKFDLVPYDLDTGSTVGNVNQAKGVKYLEAIEAYESALSAQNKAIAEKETKIAESVDLVQSKLDELEVKLKDAEYDLKMLNQSLSSVENTSFGARSFKYFGYDINTNVGKEKLVTGDHIRSKANNIERNLQNKISDLVKTIEAYKTGKLTLASQLEKLKAM